MAVKVKALSLDSDLHYDVSYRRWPHASPRFKDPLIPLDHLEYNLIFISAHVELSAATPK